MLHQDPVRWRTAALRNSAKARDRGGGAVHVDQLPPSDHGRPVRGWVAGVPFDHPDVDGHGSRERNCREGDQCREAPPSANQQPVPLPSMTTVTTAATTVGTITAGTTKRIRCTSAMRAST